MKVILMQDVRGVGKKYDIKEVSDGYGNNMLLPKKLAEHATPQAVSRIEALKKAKAANRKVHTDHVEKNLAALDGKTVTMAEKANDQGHLFASLNAKAISAAIKRATEIDIDPSWIFLDKPIKTTGPKVIEIRPHEVSAKASFTLSVEKK